MEMPFFRGDGRLPPGLQNIEHGARDGKLSTVSAVQKPRRNGQMKCAGKNPACISPLRPADRERGGGRRIYFAGSADAAIEFRDWCSNRALRAGSLSTCSPSATRRTLRGHRGRDAVRTDVRANQIQPARRRCQSRRPPPITITLFKDILFRVAAEARLGDEHHFLCFGKTNALAEHGEIQ